ncbi:unnamed protein product [Dicrocoelium dendriticum]|nr:unnamed protein product [Dicrocoelium dendriticum]
MSSDDIPGFYYDSEKKRYFKISKEELPDFVTRGTVNSKRAHNESARIARDLLSRCASTPSWTALQHLGLRERMLNRSWDSSYHNLLQSHVKNMRHQFTSNLIHGKCVLSPDTRKLFVLTETSSQSCSLIMYSTSYGSSRVRCEVKPRFTYSVEQQYVLPLSFQGLDLTWIDPGRKLAVLACKSGQPIVLVLNTDDGSILWKNELPLTSAGTKEYAPQIVE